MVLSSRKTKIIIKAIIIGEKTDSHEKKIKIIFNTPAIKQNITILHILTSSFCFPLLILRLLFFNEIEVTFEVTKTKKKL